LEIEDINAYFNRLEEMAEKTEFIDSMNQNPVIQTKLS
jgi:hypothetical protein